MTVSMDVRAFKTYLREWFGITLPSDVILEQRKEGIRAFTKPLMSLKAKGYRGVVVFSRAPTHAFALTLGRYAQRHVVEVEDPKRVLANYSLPYKGEEGWYVLRYKGYSLGMGELKRGVIHPRIPYEILRAFRPASPTPKRPAP